MRYQPTHAAPRERVPFALWGPTPVRAALTAAVAAATALVPTVMVGSPAQAASTVLTAGNQTAAEGRLMTFTFTHNGTGASVGTPAVYNITVTGGTATSGVDYSAPSASSVSFSAAGSRTVTIQTTADTNTAEGDETILLHVENAATSTDNLDLTGTITDDAPKFALTAPSLVAETATVTPPATVGGSPTTTQKAVTVTATLTAPSTHAVSIPLTTGDTGDTATSAGSANRDFDAALSPTAIAIAAGETSGTATLTLWDDSLDEDPVQYVTVVAGSATGASPVSTLAGKARIGIQDDDATPSVSIGGAGQAVEGSPLVFPLTLTGKSEKAVTVDVTTANGTSGENTYGATAGEDYTALTASTVTFPSTTTSALALVQTTSPDNKVEGSPEMLSASIANPQNATLGTTTTATGGINDLDTAPDVLMSTQAPTGTNGVTWNAGTTFDEGASGTSAKSIYVRLDKTSTIPVKIDYKFTGGTATNGTDYTGTDGTITIEPGQKDATIPVSVMGDTVYEPGNETFGVVLSSPNSSINASSVRSYTFTIGEGTDDEQPSWTVGDVAPNEGNTGTTTARMPIRLSGPTSQPVVFTAASTWNAPSTGATATEGGTNAGATSGNNDFDYPSMLSVTIPAGETVGYLDIPINADVVFEKDEKIVVPITTASTVPLGAVPTGGQHSGTLTIQNDDAPPTITFNETSGTEGTTIRVTGTVNGVADADYTVKYAIAPTGDNKATSGDDYAAQSAPADFTVTRGTTGALPAPIVDVFLQQDTVDEKVETFGITATEVGSTLVGFKTSNGVYRINDDPGDLPPTGAITDESIKEYEGSVDVTVNLTMQGDTTESTQDWSVPWWTVDGDAKDGDDYVGESGTLTIPAGSKSGKINVEILNDKLYEHDEDFYVKLGTPSPVGAAVSKSVGEVTIQSEDEPTAPSILTPSSIKGANTVLVSGRATPGTTVELLVGTFGGNGLVKVDDTQAGDDGWFRFTRKITAATRFAVRADGLTSAVRIVRIQQVPVLAVSSGAKGAVSLTVTPNPRLAGQAVTIQRLNANGKWSTVARGTTSSARTYATTLRGQMSGSSWTFRAYVGADPDAGTLGGYSVAKRVHVR